MLDMTPLVDWAVKPQHKQNKFTEHNVFMYFQDFGAGTVTYLISTMNLRR